MSDISIRNGDCLELMKDIPDKSIDMILCDLPYGITNCKWDIPIPDAPLWIEYRRIIKNNGVIALFGTEPFSTNLRMAAIDLYKYDWIWEKTTAANFAHAKNMPLKNHENISVFSPGSIGHKSLLGERRMPYNPQGLVKLEGKHYKSNTRFGSVIGKRPSNKDIVQYEYGNYPKSVLKFPKIRGSHTSEKPIPLLEYLIKTYTNEGDTVLDNCMGVGSTGIACYNLDRNFIGFELDKDFFKIAEAKFNELLLL